MTADATTEVRKSWQKKIAEGATVRGIGRQLKALFDCLTDDYAKESGVDKDTVLFSGGESGTSDSTG